MVRKRALIDGDWHFLFPRDGREALETYPLVELQGLIRLPDINDIVTPPAAASGGLSPPVYGLYDGMQSKIRASVGRQGGRNVGSIGNW